nr:Flagellar motor switch protein FliM [Leptospira interrogans serovar Copenhageni/Icterohaemorrhagiae]
MHSVSEQKKVKIYDFKRPDKFSKDQIRTLQMMHETFARLATTGLSAQLRALVSVHVASVDQLTYEEFIRSIPNPTTLAVINMDPLRGSAILEIDPSISFTIIDRLFGGKGEQAKISRELSEIEMSVMEGIIVRILGNMRESWSTVIDLRPRLGNIETNPQFAQVVPPNDMVVLITLETKIGEVEGMTNLCIPYITIEPIINKLSAQYWYSSIRKGELDENRAVIQERLDQVAIPLIAEVGSVDVSINDFMNLSIGDVVKLENTSTRSEMIVKVGEKKKVQMPSWKSRKQTRHSDR